MSLQVIFFYINKKFNKQSKKYKVKKFLGGGYYKDKRLELDNGNDNISIFSRVGRRTTNKYMNIYNREGMSPNYKEYKIFIYPTNQKY